MSFVTENSRLSGYKTCIEALKASSVYMAEKSPVTGTLLHAGLVWSLPAQSYRSIVLGPEKTGPLRLLSALSAFKVLCRSSVVLFPHPKHVV